MYGLFAFYSNDDDDVGATTTNTGTNAFGTTGTTNAFGQPAQNQPGTAGTSLFGNTQQTPGTGAFGTFG